MYKIEDYRGIISDQEIYKIYQKARKLYGVRIININSTYQGGGVAEILNSLIPLLNQVGVIAGWRILHGNPDFFHITKEIHNGMQGQGIRLTKNDKKMYVKTNGDFSVFTHINHDIVVIHDPQPLPLIQYYRKSQPWIWRCHIDISNPTPTLEFLKQFIIKYDRMIVSSKDYIMNNFPVSSKIIAPAIDPGSLKNTELSTRTIKKCLNQFNIPLDKPIICQISRFDKWKDPEGVLKVFDLVKSKIDCRLILCGSMASDDPEGFIIYDSIKNKAKDLLKKGDIILTTVENNILVNSLQRVSSVILQKSIKEGFGLTVSEALWKARPVIASNVGGISLQITDGENGFLCDPFDIKAFANRAIEILKKPKLASRLGSRGKEHVRKYFLMTRLLNDYLDLLTEVLN